MATLLATKFYVPPAPASFVARPRLLEMPGEALRHRLTLVSAAAGSGKTTLVAAWVPALRKKGVAVGWLSLDEADNDPQVFLDYIMASLEEGGLCVESGGRRSAEVENRLADLIHTILPLRRDVVLILDDYHVIQNPAIHTALAYLIDHAPARLHLMLLTRADPPLEMARLRVSGQLLELRMEQLRFSEREAGEFLEKASGMQLAEADVAALNERTEGWIAGLQMAAISMRGQEDASAFIRDFAGSHRFVFDYLLEQVLNRQRAECREFLLKTSVLERFSAALCDTVAETGGAARGLLDELERANLFLAPLDDERGWYRYHRLLSDLLRMLLEQAHPGLSAELHRRACRWFEARGMLSESLQHALAAGDMELVARVVSANVLLLFESDDAVPILQQLRSMPAQEIMSRPWLGVAQAWALGSGQLEKSQQILDGVERGLERMAEDDERRRLLGHLAAARASLFSVQGDKANAVAQAALADELLPADDMAVRALNLSVWGDVRSDDRKHDPAAVPMLERALGLAMRARKPHVAVAAAGTLASARLHLGQFREMERVCRQGLEIADEYERRNQRPLSAAANLCSLMARVYAEWGENDQAVQLARRGLLLSERWGQADTEVICLDYLGRALMLANDRQQARRICKRAEDAAKKISPWLYELTVTYNFDTLLDDEMADPAELAAQKRLVEETGAQHTKLFEARLLLRQRRPDEALAKLEEALGHLEEHISFDIARIHALRALAYHAKGDEKRALLWLRQALEIAEPENRAATFLREGRAMERLLRLPRARSIAPKFVRRLLAVFELRGQRLPQTVVADGPLIEALSQRELEVLHQLDGPLSTPEIAEQLVVSANTVRTHIKSIYGKLGVHGRSAAVRQARLAGLIA